MTRIPPPKPITLILMAVALLLASCSSPIAPISQDAAPLNVPGVMLEPGQALGFGPEPVDTPELDPRLFIHIAPIDAGTGKPVTTLVTVLLEGRVLGIGLREYTFELPGMIAERTELAVEAEGYERWSLFLRYRLTNSRRWDVPVKLIPCLPVGRPLPSCIDI